MNTEKFSEALGELHSKYIQEALYYKNHRKKTSPWRFAAKWGAAAACLALLVTVCTLLFTDILSAPFSGGSISVYAKDSDQEITSAGAVISTGTLSDTGEMRGKPLMFYLSGQDIAAVRFSCRNQKLCFMDWTEKRDEYGTAQNFTVPYGTDESEYYYLTIDWEPEAIIRELTHNPSSSIAALPEEMRKDTIVLEITFGDGRTATKAIQVSLLDDGSIFASLEDYEIGEADTFVRRPDSPAIPRDILYAQGSEPSGSIADAAPMVCVNGKLYKQSPTQDFYSKKTPEFLYLGTIESVIPNDQTVSNGVPEADFQANHPITGAEVYQYHENIVILIGGKYWLYEVYEAVEKSSDDDGSSDAAGF